MRINFQSSTSTQFDQKSSVPMNGVQFSTADTLTNGNTKDETGCFTSFLNVLTWPFRKIGELIFCCGKSNASNDWIIDEIMKDPASAAKQFVEKYPDPNECRKELRKVQIENPDKVKGIPNQQREIFGKTLLSLLMKDELLILAEIEKDSVAAAEKWTHKYPDSVEGRKVFSGLFWGVLQELKISKEKVNQFQQVCATRWGTNGQDVYKLKETWQNALAQLFEKICHLEI